MSVIFTGLSFLLAMFAPSALHEAAAIVFLAFLALFIYLDAASRCLPRCFTLAFGLTGAVWHFLLYPETALPALLTALSVFGVLWAYAPSLTGVMAARSVVWVMCT